MIFKSLVLQGFKSFPDKTEIQFSDGITAIVGPNGSGKSNISDAIRWVLGEQSSRSLRGAKMEDVIFGGTKKRTQVGFAEVSLVLGNESGLFAIDAVEVMVTRRYYRSGDSEYFLNKRHCRLRDIHELFMDTGLGRDGYSSIGQGRIDEILSLKSEDRRDVFEEAAGITKFRYRKEEAARKLNQTEENLVRIRDIYSELQSQYAPLEKQAQKAKAYLLLRDELRVLEVTLWLLTLEKLSADTSKTTQDITALATQLTQAQDAQQQLYAQEEALRIDLQNCDRDAEQIRVARTQLDEQRAQFASQVAVLQTQITNHEQNIVRTKQVQAQRQEQSQSLDQQMESHAQQLQALEHSHQEYLQTIESTQQEHTVLSARLEQCEHTREQLLQQKNSLEQQGFSLEMMRNTAQTALTGLDSRQDTVALDATQAHRTLQQAEQTAQEQQAQLAQGLQKLAQMKNQLAGMALKQRGRQAKLDQATEQLAQVTQKRAGVAQRLTMLGELQRDYEGYARSVKTIMQQRDRGAQQGIHGTVTSLIAVQNEYITAIETALGAAAAQIVVDNAKVGKDCIAYLKRTDGGRATFLPLDTIRAHNLQERALDRYDGFCGTADTLVDCAPQYRTIVQNLLARTVIMCDMNSALALAKATNHRFRIVTLDGQMLQVGGAMTGGSTGKSSGVLARTAQIQSLEQAQQALIHTQQQAEQAQHQAKRELLALQDDLTVLQNEQTQTQEAIAVLQASQTQQSTLLSHLKQRYHDLVQERDHADVAKQGYLDTIAQTEQQIAQNIQAQTAQEQQLAQIQAQLAQGRETQNQAMLTLTRCTTDAQANRQAYTATQTAWQGLQQLHTEMQQGFAGDAHTVEQFAREIVQMQQQLQMRQQDHADSEVARQALQVQLEQSLAKRMQIEGQRTAVQRQAQQQNDQILQLEREQSRLTNQLEQCKQQEKQILDQMWERYELTPTPATQVAIALENRADAEQRVRELKQQMRALGNVNLDAIEEFAQLAERSIFLGAQKDDLEQAQRELLRIIEQLTAEMEQIFSTQFALLNDHFKLTFAEMFGGGSAELVLTDPKDVLGCGIEIRVSPPGKAVKTITLLSGGERAFVAIALYFAILKVRPTPFCVLDEIEAALDDVNVIRFAQYLRKLTASTQFIVITHRRGTMEEADMLYGVTMQEQGISKMLMLNLKQAEAALGEQMR